MDYLENINIRLDKSEVIYYGGICLILYFFLSRIEFNNIILLCMIFICIFGYIIFNKNTSSNKITEEIKKENEIVISNDNIQLKQLINMIKDIKELISKNDSLYDNEKERLEKDIINLIKEYVNEIDIMVKSKSNGNYDRIIDIKKEILLNLHSMYFNSDVDENMKLSDKKVDEIIERINILFKDIEVYLKKEIKKDFYNNPNYLKKDINIYDEPSGFNNKEDLNSKIIKY